MRIPKWPLWSWFLAGAIFIAGANVAFGLPRFTTTSSAYCLSCHSTGETLNVAAASLVHPGYDRVGCSDCHSHPGVVVAEGYRDGYSADPERVSANCVKCHQSITTTNEQDGFKYNPLKINIPHLFHLETVGAKCTDCHRNIAHDSREKPTNKPRMDYCFSCHQSAQSRTCSKCHRGQIPQGSSQNQLPAQPAAGTDVSGANLYAANCAACHGKDGAQLPGADISDRKLISKIGEEGVSSIIADGSTGMPAFGVDKGGQLSVEQVNAVTEYVISLATSASAEPSSTPNEGNTPTATSTATGNSASAGLPEGEVLYASSCSACHGKDGALLPGANLKDQALISKLGKAGIVHVVSAGSGGMPALASENGGTLSQEQVQSVAEYVLSLPGGQSQDSGTGAPASSTPDSSTTESPTATSNAPSAADLYAANCQACHGDKGSTLAKANLSSREFLASRTDQQLFSAISQGIGAMPAFGAEKGGALQDDQIMSLLDLFRSWAGQ